MQHSQRGAGSFRGRGGGRGAGIEGHSGTDHRGERGYRGRGGQGYQNNKPVTQIPKADATVEQAPTIPFAFDSLEDLYKRGKDILGSSVLMPVTLAWYNMVHLNEHGDYRQLPAAWAECHQPWTYARLKQLRDAESGIAAEKGSRDKDEYAMSSANTSYGGGIGSGNGSRVTESSEILKQQQEQLSKYLQTVAKEHPIIKLCAEVVVGGTVHSFMAPMCSPLTKASCRYLTLGREGAGVEATDDERVALAESLRRHGKLPKGFQPIYRSTQPVANGAGDDGEDGSGAEEADSSLGPKKYWVTEKSDGLRVVLCTQLSHNFPRWESRSSQPSANQNTSTAAAASAWLSFLKAPSQYPSQYSLTGASLQDTATLEGARTSVSRVWTSVVNALVKIVNAHAQKTITDDEEKAKLLDTKSIGMAVLAAVSTALAETLGEATPTQPTDLDSVDLPFEVPTIGLVYDGVRNIPGVVAADVEGGIATTMLFAESDQIKSASAGSFVLRIPIPLGFLLHHLTTYLKLAVRTKLAELKDGANHQPPAPNVPQQLTSVFLLVQKTARGDGGSVILRRQLGPRHFTYLFDRSMSHVYCLLDEYPFRLTNAIMDAELILSVPPAATAPAAQKTLHRRAFFAIFDLFAYSKAVPHHTVYNERNRSQPFRLPISAAHQMQLLNRSSTKERWDALGTEVLSPMTATAEHIQRAGIEAFRQRVAALQQQAQSADAATEGSAVETFLPPPPPPPFLTLTMFRKDMWPLEELPRCLAHITKSRLNLSGDVVDQKDEEEHYLFRNLTMNDGLIFTPDDFDIIAGARKHQLKWKWPDKLSVDWKIVPLPSKPQYTKVQTTGADGSITYTNVPSSAPPHLMFKVDMFFRRKKPVEMAGDSEYRRAMRLLNPHNIPIPPAGCVAECSFNCGERLWQIEKLRKDKHESNAIMTIVSVMESVSEAIDVPTLLSILGFLPSERAEMLIAQYNRHTQGLGELADDIALESDDNVFRDFVASVMKGCEGTLNAEHPEEMDEEERNAQKARKAMIDLSQQLPLVELARVRKVEARALEAARTKAEPIDHSEVKAEPTDEIFEPIFELTSEPQVEDTSKSVASTTDGTSTATASVPRCHMSVMLSSRGGGGLSAKALFLQWHAKIAAQRNSIPCNHVMVGECYGMGEECPALHSGSRLEGLITIAMANDGGCYAWTDTVAEVFFDPLSGRWGIASINTKGNKNECYGTQVISHLESVSVSQFLGKTITLPQTLRQLTARPPLGNAASPVVVGNTQAPGTIETDNATMDDYGITSSAVNAAHYALRTKELRDNDETSRIRRFNNWVKAVLMSNAAAFVRSELSAEAAATANTTTLNKKAAALAFAQSETAIAAATAGTTPISVCELCCGRGGDLHKWRAHLSGGYLLMVDHCFEAVAEAARRYSVGKGLSTKVAKDKDGYPGIPARFAVKSCFSDALLPVIEECKTAAPQPQLIDKGFHIVSCQFSMHYAFQTEQQVRNFLNNVSATLRVGGIFIGTTCDDRALLARRAKFGNSFGNDHYSVSFDIDDSDIVASVDSAMRAGGAEPLEAHAAAVATSASVSSCYGTPYRFSLEASVVGEVEYVVDWERFKTMAEQEYQLVCVESHNFKSFRDEHKRTQTGQKLWDDFLGDDALRKKGLKSARGEGNGDNGSSRVDDGSAPAETVLTPEEEEAVSLYRTFVFQKTKA